MKDPLLFWSSPSEIRALLRALAVLLPLGACVPYSGQAYQGALDAKYRSKPVVHCVETRITPEVTKTRCGDVTYRTRSYY